MKVPQIIPQKIYDLAGIEHQVRRWRLLSKTVSFTNGCFDILHQGHIASLSDAAREADILVVGVNSDSSTRRLKGESRPINGQDARATLLASLLMVDAVVIFDEDTPLQLITTVMPDVLVKGGDYTLEQIVGAKEVMASGGRVVINPMVPGFSTTGIIDKICQL
ncbi:D-glycero-beta-D-manno-heptose 1-phosphate adenylyltransferase [Puia sp.]|uniref:D-glycero-beta-D-manno-heptose 1-phosphate adenylyltransferase n=1 Tax=Puia sp. TaxID=2045100 RepID=UPI002F3EA73D